MLFSKVQLPCRERQLGGFANGKLVFYPISRILILDVDEIIRRRSQRARIPGLRAKMILPIGVIAYRTDSEN
jgi:hypothetical protein